MTEESQKLYRLQHLVPPLVHSTANSNSDVSEKDNLLKVPKEVQFNFTWGTIAGSKKYLQQKHLDFLLLRLFSQQKFGDLKMDNQSSLYQDGL